MWRLATSLLLFLFYVNPPTTALGERNIGRKRKGETEKKANTISQVFSFINLSQTKRQGRLRDDAIKNVLQFPKEASHENDRRHKVNVHRMC